MRWAAWFLGAAVAASVPGCVDAPGDVLDSVVTFAQAVCDGDVDRVLEYVHDPVYVGTQGPKDREQVAAMVAADGPHEPAFCPAAAMLRTDDARIMTPADVETEFDVAIADTIPGYAPGDRDRYVVVPLEKNPHSDDPLQGFWRPSDGRWVQVALFG